MKKILCFIIAIVSVLSLCACAGRGDSALKGYERSENIPQYDYMSGEDTKPENYDKYTAGSMDFAFALLRETASLDESENTLVSPVSLATALSLLSNGTSDSTRKELRNALAGGLDVEYINSGNHYLSGRLTALNTEESKFTTANALWLNDTFDVKSAFLQTAVNYYDTDVQRTLFSEGDIVKKVNNWISDNTDGEITDMVDSVDVTSPMILVNAVLLDDEWATPYPDESVSDGKFHGAKGDETVPFMTSTEQYMSTSYAQGMSKGFKNLPLRFAALLPAEDMKIEEFVQGLTGAKWQALLDSLESPSFCNATLPEFELYTKNDLKSPLEAMGVKKIFDAEKADFSALSNTGKVSVSDVIQDAFVKIGPKNVKAGAATVIGTDGASPVESDFPKLVFDRPFVFVIYDNESGIPVFTGVVNDIAK